MGTQPASEGVTALRCAVGLFCRVCVRHMALWPGCTVLERRCGDVGWGWGEGGKVGVRATASGLFVFQGKLS